MWLGAGHGMRSLDPSGWKLAPGFPAWNTSLASVPRATNSARAASMFETIR